MRLTQSMCDQFVNSVMSDVPSVDYGTEIADRARQMSRANMPPWLQDCCAKHKDLEGFLQTGTHWGTPTSYYLAGPLTAENVASLEALVKAARQQQDARADLRRKLLNSLAACSTVKQLADTYPEFAKYLPKEASATVDRTVPAANVVADFVKAGWPK